LSAKSRRDEKPIFEFPEFDKEEYIEKEFRDARVSRFVILLAVTIALLSYVLVTMSEDYRIVGLFLIFLAIASQKEFFLALKIDISAFEKKNWVGNSLLLFFAWFGVFTLLLNPPFMDLINPQVESIDVYTITNVTADNKTYSLDKSDTLLFNTTIAFNATVTDNSKVESVKLTIKYPDSVKEFRDMELTGVKDNEYTGGELTLNQEGTYTFTIEVVDNYDNTKTKIHSVQVQPQ
jgi:hypothetical protein